MASPTNSVMMPTIGQPQTMIAGPPVVMPYPSNPRHQRILAHQPAADGHQPPPDPPGDLRQPLFGFPELRGWLHSADHHSDPPRRGRCSCGRAADAAGDTPRSRGDTPRSRVVVRIPAEQSPRCDTGPGRIASGPLSSTTWRAVVTLETITIVSARRGKAPQAEGLEQFWSLAGQHVAGQGLA